MKKIEKSDLNIWIKRLVNLYELIIPVKENVINFKPITRETQIVLQFTNSVIPPKHFFFPQTETLFTWHKEKGDFKLKVPQNFKKERIIWGIRACDVKSLLLFDFIFANKFKDFYYLNKREKTILISLACNKPQDTCFCSSFGISPISKDGTDILLIELDECYLVIASTNKGKKLINLASELFSHTEEDYKQYVNLRTQDILPDKTYDSLKLQWNNKIWEELAEKCIGCGVCTYLCPTCYCFDIQDEEDFRLRCWDSCMFSEFTLMAGGENPRKTKKERIKNRYFHKFKYLKEKYKIFGCVGCGRCIIKCPVNIDITRVVKQLGNYE